MSHNEITGDEIKSKVNTAEYEANYDKIFRRKPESLDAAYERRAMMQGLVVNPLFEENKELVEQRKCKCSFRTKLVGDGCEECNQDLVKYLIDYSVVDDPASWDVPPWYDDAAEQRMDIIGQNGNDGLVYEEQDILCKICGKNLNTTQECAYMGCPLLFKSKE